MTILANCKINLGLNIIRRREDGYHDLSTVMYPVKALHDRVEVVSCDSEEVTLSASGIIVDCPVEKNLCVKAARLMQSRYGVGGVHISLDKVVPFGAGLGGGSADATAVVVAINDIYSLGLGVEKLVEVASQLGSDTPFFVHNTPQLCHGRGEVMSPIDIDLSPYNIVMVKPEVSVSTAEAYAGVRPEMPSTPLEELLTQPIEMWQRSVKNDFEPHIFAMHPSLRNIKEEMIAQGALYASMSGSGSTIYGIFPKSAEIDEHFISTHSAHILPL